MIRYNVALVFVFLFLTGCTRSNVVVVTPLNVYTREDILGKAEAYCRKYGMLPVEVQEDKEIWKRLIDDVIRECVYADLALVNGEEINAAAAPDVTEDEIRSKYETLFFSQKQYFTQKKESVTAAIMYPRDTILYYPKGLKWVKMFIIPFEAGVRGLAAIYISEGKLGDYERLAADAEESMMPQIKEARLRLQNGAGFDELIKEYGADGKEDLLYDEDPQLFGAQLRALKTLEKPGDIAEYNIYQGHVFMMFVREPDYVELPYETVRNELADSIRAAKIILQRDRQMKKLYTQAITNGSVKLWAKRI